MSLSDSHASKNTIPKRKQEKRETIGKFCILNSWCFLFVHRLGHRNLLSRRILSSVVQFVTCCRRNCWWVRSDFIISHKPFGRIAPLSIIQNLLFLVRFLDLLFFLAKLPPTFQVSEGKKKVKMKPFPFFLKDNKRILWSTGEKRSERAFTHLSP